MNEIYRKIVDMVHRNREDGFEVPAVRVGEDEYHEILNSSGFMTAIEVEKGGLELEYEDSIGKVAGTEVIIDDSISGVVAEDVRGLWRDE